MTCACIVPIRLHPAALGSKAKKKKLILMQCRHYVSLVADLLKIFFFLLYLTFVFSSHNFSFWCCGSK